MTTLKGIDVSEHNGIIGWEKVKADGIEFAMLRLGFGSDQKDQDDSQFERSVQECERLGISWGAYLYSYALNVESAKSEAAHALRLLKGKHPSYPVAFDMEDADGYKAKYGMPSNDLLVNICMTFLSTVESAGHHVMLYASKSWLESKLNSSKLDKYGKWVAQWSDNLTYKGKNVVMWQFSDSGTVRGINKQVDMNYSYQDFGQKDNDVYYRIVTGTFPSASAFADALDKIKKLGLKVYEKADSTNWNPTYRIVTGSFNGRAAAQKAADKLKKDFGWTAYIENAYSSK